MLRLKQNHVYQPTGRLPVRVPNIVEQDGEVFYAEDSTLYERGHGLAYEYVFVEGADGVHAVGSTCRCHEVPPFEHNIEWLDSEATYWVIFNTFRVQSVD